MPNTLFHKEVFLFIFITLNKRLKNKILNCIELRLIGDILGHDQLGVGDCWYAKRIDHFIQTGKIRIVEDSENKYARTICLA
ncbi:MAG: hypothetical protein HDR28_12620 [Lachnospiraceae bacterium]|nr:hypothetical protein [Lachnospiraceae bacterium]